MIEHLTLLNLDPNVCIPVNNGEIFVLRTCQRTIVLGFDNFHEHIEVNNTKTFDVFEGKSAYKFLLETISGLKSEVLAEYEIVSQFKQAFCEYSALPKKSSQIVQLFERIFKDSKFIRTNALNGIGQLSYAGIARKLIYTQNPSAEVLILGSGNLAEDLIKLLKKKHTLYICARNEKKVQDLAVAHSVKVIPWDKKEHLVKFKYMANTIGHDEIIFDENFFNAWGELHYESKLFIDLGSPSVIRTSKDKEEGVVRLQDIFKKSAVLNEEKMKKINKAYNLIDQLTEKSFEYLVYRLSDTKIQDLSTYEKTL
jgi:glutamyl-tRNA reductase